MAEQKRYKKGGARGFSRALCFAGTVALSSLKGGKRAGGGIQNYKGT